jgi:hypothetical protein
VKVSRVDLETSRIDFVLAQTNKLTPISEEDSILPERYRDKTKSASHHVANKSAGVKAEDKKTDRKPLKVSAPWDANASPKSSRAKNANANKSRSHKAGHASSKPSASNKSRPAKTSSGRSK